MHVILIWRNGHVLRRFHAGQFIGGWQFAAGGKEVAFFTERLHANPDATCYRESVESGRK